ncbi:uncharacterized protein LOC128725215 [Anopheles nili]|uniref:uncharacterized protein LOC128725215 n=1 Tax=Anopheles nili TaxID=185578 RepID=UPI00237AA938|nr:uncharacterized protein LOC128725215 [Anopheles nili]
MENKAPMTEMPVCNIDRREPDKIYISAWRDKAEFSSVYEQIFNSTPEDIESKEKALQWLNIWKIRQVMDFPVCIRCTYLVLEAQVFDLRFQRQDSQVSNATEVKNIYSGAFTRFVNFITEASGGNRRRSIADHVRDIGIETYLVELRHLCAHRSVSISLDVFRRSAQYCMDWLKTAYWQRELNLMKPVKVDLLQCENTKGVKIPDPSDILRLYDVASTGIVRKADTITKAASDAGLTADEINLLEKTGKSFGFNKLSAILKHAVRLLYDLKMPYTQATVAVMCNGVFTHCKHLFEDAVKYGKDGQMPLGKIHSELFRYLASIGCLQAFFERLVIICERGAPTVGTDMRPAASYWAYRIGVGFQLLKQYKKALRSLPPEKMPRFGQALKDTHAKQWYQERLKSFKAAEQHIILGLSVDCPWHLKFSRAFAKVRLAAMNEHTQDIVPIIISFVEPPITDFELMGIKRVSLAYKGEDVIFLDGLSDDDEAQSALKQRTKGIATSVVNTSEVYSPADLLETINKKRAHTEESSTTNKKLKLCGLWSDPDNSLDWKSYPLGMFPGLV